MQIPIKGKDEQIEAILPNGKRRITPLYIPEDMPLEVYVILN